MRNSKYSEHQIIAILKAVEAGRTVKDVLSEARDQRGDSLQVEGEVRRYGSS